MKARSANCRSFNNVFVETNEWLDVARQVAHDIRAPLSVLNILSRSFQQLPEESRDLAQAAIQRINDIANGLLEKGKVTKHIPNPSGLPEKVVPLIHQVVLEKRLLLSAEAHIHMTLDIDQAGESLCQVNRVGLQRVFSNLLDNAIESFDSEGGQVSVKVEKKEKHLEIEISDNGRGIPESILECLGRREISYGKELRSPSGTGLGVMHAKTLVEAFGGELRILSQMGYGTTVRILLPRLN